MLGRRWSWAHENQPVTAMPGIHQAVRSHVIGLYAIRRGERPLIRAVG